MKITKTQLQKIIKEELNEMFAGYSSGGHPSSNVRGSSYGREQQSYELELAIQLLVDAEDALNTFFDKNAGKDNAVNALLGDAADDLRKVIEAIADFKDQGLYRR